MKSNYYISRNKVLQEFHILDSEKEDVFDDLTKIAASICKTDYSAISIIDDDRQWFKSTYGFDLKETPLDHSICKNFISKYDDGLYIPDLSKDKKFKSHPALINSNTRFYAGFPIKTESGFTLGSLCVFDSKPKKLTEFQLGLLKIFTNQAKKLIYLHKKSIALNEEQKSLSRWMEATIKVAKNSDIGGLYLNKSEKFLIWGPSNNSMFGLKEDFEISFDDFVKGDFQGMGKELTELIKVIREIYLDDKSIKYQKDFFFDKSKKWITLKIEYENDILTVAIIDVTINQRLKNKLHSYQLMMNEVEKISKIGGFEYDLKSDNVKFTNNSYKIFNIKNNQKIKFQDIVKYFDEKSHKEVIDDINKSIIYKIPYNNIRKIKLSSGEEKIIKISSNPVVSKDKVISFIGSIRDITEEYYLEEELIKSKQIAEKSAFFFKSIVENNQIFVVILNNKTKLEYCNTYFRKFMSESLGNEEANLKKIIEKKFLSIKLDPARLNTSRNQEFKTIEVGKNKKSYSVLWNASIIEQLSKSDELILFVGLDITETEENKWQINQLVDLASQQSKALLEFNNIISHNLRGEVSNLHGLLNLIELVNDESEKDIYLNLIKQCTRNLDAILFQLNKFTALGFSEPILLEPVPLMELLDKICKRIFSVHAKSNLDYSLNISPSHILLSSNEYLERIFSSLLLNCIHFRSSKRPLRVEIRSRQIDTEHLEIEIKDNGTGMDLSYGYDKLFQINHTIHRISGKKGFGLFFVKKIMDMLEGSIQIESKIDEGTIVTLKFPNHEF